MGKASTGGNGFAPVPLKQAQEQIAVQPVDAEHGHDRAIGYQTDLLPQFHGRLAVFLGWTVQRCTAAHFPAGYCGKMGQYLMCAIR